MNHTKTFLSPSVVSGVLAVLLLVAGPALAADTPAASAPSPKAAKAAGTIRIMAALEKPHTDETGITWLPAQGFLDGDTMERPDLKIGNTKTPSIYRSERFGMSKFSRKLANGNYTVKLHFAVTYEGISGPGEVVFTVVVAGREIKDLDIWKKAGGGLRAYVETVSATVTNGELEISFISQSENPTISAIEIIPAP